MRKYVSNILAAGVAVLLLVSGFATLFYFFAPDIDGSDDCYIYEETDVEERPCGFGYRAIDNSLVDVSLDKKMVRTYNTSVKFDGDVERITFTATLTDPEVTDNASEYDGTSIRLKNQAGTLTPALALTQVDPGDADYSDGKDFTLTYNISALPLVNNTGFIEYWIYYPATGEPKEFNLTGYFWVNAMYDNFAMVSQDGYFTSHQWINFSVHYSYYNGTEPNDINITMDGNYIAETGMTPAAMTSVAYPSEREYFVEAEAGTFSGGKHTLVFNTSEPYPGTNIPSTRYDFWINRDPVFSTPISDVSTDAGHEKMIDLDSLVTDADGDALEFSTNFTQDFVTVDNANKQVRLSPGLNDVGEFDIWINASDGNGSWANDMFTLTVNQYTKGFYGYGFDPSNAPGYYVFNVSYVDENNENITEVSLNLDSLSFPTSQLSNGTPLSERESYDLSQGVDFGWIVPGPLESGKRVYNYSVDNETGDPLYSDDRAFWLDVPPEVEIYDVDPNFGGNDTHFNFTAHYSDPDGDPADYMKLYVNTDFLGEMETLDGQEYWLNTTYDTIGVHDVSVATNNSNLTEEVMITAENWLAVGMMLTNFGFSPMQTDYVVGEIIDFQVTYWNYDNNSADEVTITIGDGTFLMETFDSRAPRDGVVYEYAYEVSFDSPSVIDAATIDAYNHTYGTSVSVDFPISPSLNVIYTTEGDLNGRVTDISTGENLSNVNVLVWNDSGLIDDDLTNAYGNYSMFGIPAGTYNLTLNKYGYHNETVPGVDIYAAQTTIQNGEMSEWSHGSVAVHVRDEAGENLSEVEVTVSSPEIYEGHEFDEVMNGSVENITTFADLPTIFSLYNVSASKAGYLPAYNDSVAVEAGATTHVYLSLEKPKGFLKGRVTEAAPTKAAGDPIQAALVQVYQGSELIDSTTTNESGWYEMEVLVGEWTVNCSAPSFITESRTGIDVFEGQTTDLYFSLTPMPTTGDLNVLVFRNGTDDPIEGANVTLTSDGDEITHGLTNFEGWIGFTELDPGIYLVNVSHENYTYNTAEANITAGQVEDITVFLNERPPSTASFDIGPWENAEGSALTGATVALETRTRADSVVDSAGMSSFADVEYGEYIGTFDNQTVTWKFLLDVDSGSDGQTLAPGDLMPAAGYDSWPPDSLVPKYDVEVSIGPIRDKDGKVIEGATVTVTVGGQEESGMTDDSGMVTLSFEQLTLAQLEAGGEGTFQHPKYNDGDAISFTITGTDLSAATSGPVALDQSRLNGLSADSIGEKEAAGDGEKEQAFDPTWALVAVVVLVIIIIIAAMASRGSGREPMEEVEFLEGEYAPPAVEEMVSECECPECGAPVDCEAQVCPECGEEFLMDEYQCPTCGAIVREEDMFCPECGEDFGAEAGEEIILEEEPEVFEEDELEEDLEEDEEFFDEEEEAEMFEEEEF